LFPKETKCIIYYIYRPINEIYQEGYFLVNTEILRLDHETDPQHAFVLIVFQKVLTVTIIILQEEILVLVIIKLIAQLDLGVKAEPSLSFGQDNPAVKAPVVCPVIGGYLEYTIIFKDVFIFLAIHDRYPALELNFPVLIQQDSRR